jgi:putative ABC transport system permease protein
VYPLAIAQQLFGRPNGLDAIYIVPTPGTTDEQLATTLTPIIGSQNRVVDTTSDQSGLGFITAQLLPAMLLISLFGLAVGAQLVFNAMSLSLEERRRELAIESAVGGSPRTIVAGVLTEATVIGLVGGAIGVVASLLVARPFIGTISHYAEQAAGIHLAVHTSPGNFGVGLAIGIVAAIAAAIVPARRAARLELATELADRTRTTDVTSRARARRPIVLGTLVLIGLLLATLATQHHGLEPWSPTALLVGIMLVFICAFPLTPSLVPYALRWVERLPFLQRGPARVAMSNLSTDTRRTSTVLMAVTAAVGMSVMLGSVLVGMEAGAEQLTADTAHGRVMVSTLTPNNNAAVDAKLAPDVQAALAQLPEVERVERVYHASLDMPGIGLVAVASGDGDTSGFEVYEGESLDRARQLGHVMIGPGLARTMDLGPGSTFEVPGRNGPVTLTVGGIWASPDTLGRSITMNVDLFERTVGPRPVDWVLLVPKSGVTPAQLATRVRAERLAPNILVFDPDELVAELTHDFQGFTAPFEVLARGLLVVAFIATASTLLLAGVKRRAEHGLLAAVGMPPGDLGRMVLVEAGLFGVLGTACGFVSGALSLWAFSTASTTMTGLYIPFQLSVAPLLTSGLVATAFVLAGAALPAYRTSRLDPVIALRYE